MITTTVQYSFCAGNLVVSQLMDEFLLDFDLFHVREPTELLRHIDIKFLPVDFGGHVSVDPGSWILLQVRPNKGSVLLLVSQPSDNVTTRHCQKNMTTLEKLGQALKSNQNIPPDIVRWIQTSRGTDPIVTR